MNEYLLLLFGFGLRFVAVPRHLTVTSLAVAIIWLCFVAASIATMTSMTTVTHCMATRGRNWHTVAGRTRSRRTVTHTMTARTSSISTGTHHRHWIAGTSIAMAACTHSCATMTAPIASLARFIATVRWFFYWNIDRLLYNSFMMMVVMDSFRPLSRLRWHEVALSSWAALTTLTTLITLATRVICSVGM